MRRGRGLVLCAVLMLLLELMLLVWLGASDNKSILLGEDTDDANGDLVVNDDLVVLADDVDVEFLRDDERTDVLLRRQT